jgi:hypothetical protein
MVWLGVLVQVREALRLDGLFLGAMFGGDSLFELRSVKYTLTHTHPPSNSPNIGNQNITSAGRSRT